MAVRVDVARRALGGRTWVGSNRYQDVSELAYHLPGRPTTFCTCVTGRHNQYELWPSFASTAAPTDNLVLALEETPGTHDTVKRLAPYFGRVTRGGAAPLLRGTDTVETRRIWVLEDYRGGWPVRVGP